MVSRGLGQFSCSVENTSSAAGQTGRKPHESATANMLSATCWANRTKDTWPAGKPRGRNAGREEMKTGQHPTHAHAGTLGQANPVKTAEVPERQKKACLQRGRVPPARHQLSDGWQTMADICSWYSGKASSKQRERGEEEVIQKESCLQLTIERTLRDSNGCGKCPEKPLEGTRMNEKFHPRFMSCVTSHVCNPSGAGHCAA
jgi:hypothetical protein